MNIGKRFFVLALVVLCIVLASTQASAGAPYTPVYTYNNNLSIVGATGTTTGGANDILFTWDGTLKTSVAASGQVTNGYINARTNNGGFVQTCKTGTGGTAWKGHDVTLYGPGSYTVFASCAPGAPACAGGTKPISFTVGAGEIGLHMLVDWGIVASNKNIDVVNVFTPGVFGPSAMWTGACGANPAGTVWDQMSKDHGTGKNGYPMVDGPFIGTTWNFNLKGPAINRIVDTSNNNFTMLDPNGAFIAGTNDVRFTWDGTMKTAVECPQVSNATISSPCPLFGTGKTWAVHDVAVYGPGTYTINAASPAGCPNYETTPDYPITFTVAGGEMGVHMLLMWPGNDDNDVVDIWRPNKVFAPSPLMDNIVNFIYGCGSNPASTVWDWMSYDWGSPDGAGGVIQVPNLINGAPMTDGPFGGSYANFNVMGKIVCTSDAECNDNNVCTTEFCDTATSKCVYTHTTLSCDDGNACTTGDVCANGICKGTTTICNDNNACTTDACDPATGNCVYAPNTLPCNDHNACTANDTCSGGTCTGTPIVCNDNNACTTDTCDPAIGCVFTTNTLPCNDNNACTMNDVCSGGVCVPGTPMVCIGGVVCDPATGCSVTSTGNNFSLLFANGFTSDGTNDVKFTWDGTLQNATTFANGTGPSNATISSDEPLDGWLWYAKHVQVVGPGTYWVDLDGSGPGTNRFEVTIPAGQIGAHLLLDTGSTGQATSCGKASCDVDVWVAWDYSGKAFAAGKLFTGADDGANYNQSSDNPPVNSVLDGRVNAGTKVWDLVSVDLAGRITNAAGATIINLPLDKVPGIKIMEGEYYYYNVNFNLMLTDLCADAATRCNDNNKCTNDFCDPLTGACSHPAVVCNDDNACTTDGCNTATGCTFTVKDCNDNNPCTDDYCTMQGTCVYPAHACNDNNPCTTDTCVKASGGCVFTNNTLPCTDNNACTVNDTCSGGACISGATKTCPSGICSPATGCPVTNVSTSGNNMTIITPFIVYGGTNDVKFTWDGIVQNASTFANGAGLSNATISSDEPLDEWLWYAKHVQVVGPGTYWTDLDGAGPSLWRYEVTIPAGRIGAHMLLDLGPTGQATTCGKVDCDVDAWVVWDFNNAFNNAFIPGKMFTGADNGIDYNQSSDNPPVTSLLDGQPNTDARVWDLVSVDVAGRVITPYYQTYALIRDLSLDKIPGLKLQEGVYKEMSVNFNVMLQ